MGAGGDEEEETPEREESKEEKRRREKKEEKRVRKYPYLREVTFVCIYIQHCVARYTSSNNKP